ncbi:MAG: glycosyltransferase [Pirellulaceae bacterium]|nr:glycosyltransferase [Pirellulaceae bacterium]
MLSPAPMSGLTDELFYEIDYTLETYRGGFSLKGITSIGCIACSGGFDVAVVCGTGWNAMLGVLLNRRLKKRVFFEVMSGVRNGKLDPRDLVNYGFDAVVGQAPAVREAFCSNFQWHGISASIPAFPDPLELATTISEPIQDLSKGLRGAYFGRLEPHKGVGFLLDNWKAISTSIESLDIYGDGSQKVELEKQIHRLNLASRVRLLGAYPQGAAYVKLLQQYHLTLLPTTGQEGAPLVLLESMACGVPFVANGVGGIRGYINEDCQITSGQIGEFVPALRALCDRLTSGKVDAKRLQNFYEKNFSFRALSGKWNSFLTDL